MEGGDSWTRPSAADLEVIRDLISAGDFTSALHIVNILQRLHGEEQELTTLAERCADMESRLEQLRGLRSTARTAVAQGNYTEAYDHWNRILELAPDDKEALHHVQGLRRILQSKLEDQTYIRDIRTAFALGDYEHALKLLQKLPMEESFKFDLQTMYEEVIRARSQRDHADRLHQCALTAVQHGQLIEALRLWNQALDLMPDHRSARIKRSSAREAYAQSKEDEIKQNWLKEAEKLLSRSDFDRGKTMCDRAAAIWPRDVQVRELLNRTRTDIARRQEVADLIAAGKELWRQDRTREAIRKWEVALEVDPLNVEADQLLRQIRELADGSGQNGGAG